MRRGIGLRGYAQQDPLNEFKREAFQLYEELRGLIRHGVASSIFRVTVTRQPPEAAGGDPAVAASLARGAAALAGGNGVDAPAPAAAASRGHGATVPAGVAAGARRWLGRAPGRTGGAGHAPGARIARRRAGRRAAAAPAAGGPKPGFTPSGRADRAQRPVLVRIGREVQEVPRPLTGPLRERVRTDGEASFESARDLLGGRDHRLPRDRRRSPATRRIAIWAQGQRDEQRPADAIVVLGAAQYDGRPSPIFAARLDHAIELYRAGVAPRLVVTGGKADGDRTTEAAAARAYAIARGVPAEAILVEDQRPDHARVDPRRRRHPARPTGSARRSSCRIGPHMLRVLRMARDDGIDGLGIADRHEPDRARSDRPARTPRSTSCGALVLYFLVGSQRA